MIRCLRRARKGNVLLVVVAVLFGLGFASSMWYVFHSLTIRQLRARDLANEAEAAAESVVRVMGERLVSAAEWHLGALTQEVIDSLNAEISTITLPGGTALVEEATGYFVTRVTSGEPVPFDETPLRTVSDHPRVSFMERATHDGARATSTIEVEVVARARAKSARASAVAKYAITRVAPHQYAIYADGDAVICVSGGSDLVVAGTVRADGSLTSSCDGDRIFGGDVLAQQSIVVDGFGTQQVAVDASDLRPLSSASRADMRGAPASWLDQWGGRVRVGSAFGGFLANTVFQTGNVAGTGPCTDGAFACSGLAAFFPSVQVQRTVQGAGTSFDIRCGWAYDGDTCASVAAAMSYWPYPFTDQLDPGVARLHPGFGDVIWRGLFPDYRREDRCTASLPGGIVFRTFRCITNPFGFTLDGSLLPPIPGGVLHVQRWSMPPVAMNPFQEVLLIKNAEKLAGPLTIVSEIPVVLQGSFNTIQSVPALIDAPLITVLPAEAELQRASTSVWDSTALAPHTMLAAHTPVRIRAVLRSDYHAATAWGGLVEQVPAVLGDFSGVTLEVHGAVEGREKSTLNADAYAQWHPSYGDEPTTMRVRQPAGRRVVYDPLLRLATFQPRGAWFWPNIPPSGYGTRTRLRQQGAFGGYTLIRRSGEVRILAESYAPQDTLILASRTSPIAPTASFTANEDAPPTGAVSFDASASSDADGTIREYHWNFGDGAAARGPNVVHAYSAPGDYLVTLTVIDNDGLVARDTATVSVIGGINLSSVPGDGPGGIQPNHAPVALMQVPADTLLTGLSYLLTGKSSYDTDGSVIDYHWDFGDATSLWGVRVPEKVYTDPGKRNITLTVWDEDMAPTLVSHEVTVLQQLLDCPESMLCPSWQYTEAYATSDTDVTFTSGNGSVLQWKSADDPPDNNGRVQQHFQLSEEWRDYILEKQSDDVVARFVVRARGPADRSITLRMDWRTQTQQGSYVEVEISPHGGSTGFSMQISLAVVYLLTVD